MTVILKHHKLFYASVPKIACSSIKRVFFKIENGFDFELFRSNGRLWHIHHFYPVMFRENFPESEIADFRRLTIVRDPVKRFLSAYGNRVVTHKKISEAAVKKAGRLKNLRPHPDLHEFTDRFEKYLAIPDIGHHCRPLTTILGTDASYFHAVYDIKQIDAFLDDVSNVVGQKVEAGHYKGDGPKFKSSDLTAKQIEKIERHYKRDYEVFGAFF